MKSFIYVFIWTILFVLVGVYINKEAIEFTNLYNDKVTIIEEYIKDDNWDEAKKTTEDAISSWNNNKSFWYKLLNHDSFDLITLHLNILNTSIYTNDKSKALENIEIIKITLENIVECENYDLNHIF